LTLFDNDFAVESNCFEQTCLNEDFCNSCGSFILQDCKFTQSDVGDPPLAGPAWLPATATKAASGWRRLCVGDLEARALLCVCVNLSILTGRSLPTQAFLLSARMDWQPFFFYIKMMAGLLGTINLSETFAMAFRHLREMTRTGPCLGP